MLNIHRLQIQLTTCELVPAADRAAIVQICRLVQGMPLALELAAAWVRVLSCGEIAQEIAQSLGFLTTTLRVKIVSGRSPRPASATAQ